MAKKTVARSIYKDFTHWLIVPVYLEIGKSSDNLRNRMKLRTIKWRDLMPFFSDLPVESAKIYPPEILSPKSRDSVPIRYETQKKVFSHFS